MTAAPAIRPFRIDVPDSDIEDLRSRLARTRWPNRECVDDWSQGLPLAYARDLAAYWADGYDWRVREARLNRYDQFVTEVDGLDLHFIHQRSPEPNAFPLVITHGWPGTVAEFQSVIGPLTDPVAHGGNAEDAFHVVCPSLPGFGFSGKPTTTGWGVDRIAAAFRTLMSTLGYERFGAQGGDWGSAVTRALGMAAGPCVAIHLNLPVGRPVPGLDLSDHERAILARTAQVMNSERGYSAQQATRPQTLGYGLADSPVGQMTWIVEKFAAWMDCGGDPESVVHRDELLDNVMLYWLTNTATSAARLYWESFENVAPQGHVAVPTGVADFPGEVARSPRSWCEQVYNIVHWTTMPCGGHFAAFEQPELFVEDLRTFFRGVRQC